MPGVVMEVNHEEGPVSEVNENGNSTNGKENLVANKSLNEGLTTQNPQNGSTGNVVEGEVETSIEQLYENVCEMQSSDHSPSRVSFGSEGEESRIDSELRHLVGGEMREVEIMEEEEEVVRKPENDDSHSDIAIKKESSSINLENSQSGSTKTTSAQSKKATQSQLESDASAVSSPKGKSPHGKPPKDKRNEKNLKKGITGGIFSKKQSNSPSRGLKLQNGSEDSSESGLDNPDLGPFLLKQARDLISSGDNPQKALDLALRAAKSFERCADGKPSLDLVMSLHVTAAIYCNLGQYSDAILVLEHSIESSVIGRPRSRPC